MNRRDFLKLASGAAVALAVGPLPIPAPKRTWKAIALTGWHQVPDRDAMQGMLWGLRSDGEYFAVFDAIWTTDFKPEIIDADVENMRNTLDTFLDCDCRVGATCQQHREMFVA